MKRAVLGVLVAIAQGCAADPAPSPPDGPFDPAAEIRPDLIVAEPQRVAPGEIVALTFPERTTRGIHFVLERRDDPSWDLVYHLIASADPDEDSFFSPGDEGVAIPDIGITGPGPDRVRIPGDVARGSYRICTANAGDEFCAAIEVVAGT
jgi:hypothetical protein